MSQNSRDRLLQAAKGRHRRNFFRELGIKLGVLDDPLISQYVTSHGREIQSAEKTGSSAYIVFHDGRKVYVKVENHRIKETEVDTDNRRIEKE